MTTRRPGRLLRAMLGAPARLYDWHLGWLLGHRFLRLTHTGRHTGRTYRTVLEVVGTDPAFDEVTVMAGLGTRADWYRNITARPATEIAIGRRRFTPEHRVLGEVEAAMALANYERRNRLAAPVIRIVLSRLVGWHYDASPQARARLVRELPLIAFRPDHDS
jgi:deazaflavin-dependent oxidoreductase (nitroreductase family)